MSLLEKATLITTPTAHSNGTLHSIKGGSVADFDVVRGSAATRVNAEGLIEDISIISGELVSNGDFTTDSNWSKGSGWSIIGGEAEFNGSAFGGVLLQSSVVVVGKKYLVSLNVISGSVRIKTGTSSYTTYTEPFTVYADLNGDIAIQSLSSVSSIDNISVVEVIDATNIPRIDYTTGEGVVLLEPQSTNLIPYSEDFTSLNTRDNAVATSNQITSPSGLLDADEITFDGTLYGRIETFVSATNGATYTISVYLKNNDLSDVTQVWLGFAQTGQGQFITITNEWQRYDITLAANGTTEYPRIQFSGTGSLYAWGFQTEELPYATSYIPTSGAIATRLADSVTGAGDATTFNSTEGVLYFEASALNDTSTTARRLSISDGSGSNRLYFYYLSSGGFAFASFVGGVLQANITFSGTITNNSKVACKYKENDYSLWVDGVEVGTDTSASVWSSGTLNTLNFNDVSSTSPFYGKVKALAVFNEALTDVELECLTTI